MKVQEIMTETVQACAPETDLASAVALMWKGDCGTLPVVADGGKVVGMITDRDIAIALGTRNKPAWTILVKEIMSEEVYACRPEDDIHAALKTIRKHQVHRLPVLDTDGKIKGLLSLNDVTLQVKHLDGQKGSDLTYEDVVNTLKAVYEHRHPKKSHKTAAH